MGLLSRWGGLESQIDWVNETVLYRGNGGSGQSLRDVVQKDRSRHASVGCAVRHGLAGQTVGIARHQDLLRCLKSRAAQPYRLGMGGGMGPPFPRHAR